MCAILINSLHVYLYFRSVLGICIPLVDVGYFGMSPFDPCHFASVFLLLFVICVQDM